MKNLLTLLEEKFEQVREPVMPLFPYDKTTNMISLPPKVEKRLRQLVLKGQKIEAVKQITHLTGAGLRLSKDYVDNLVTKEH